MRVIIVGGGIAGLSTALSLHQIGVDCRVYEAVAKLEPVGHGINLQPNAVRELTALGLGEQLADVGILTAELAFYNRHGQLIWTEPRGKAAGYKWPQISISRGKLQEILLAAVHARLGRQALVTGHQLVSLAQRGDKVLAHFNDPAGRPVGEAQGDLLIGADGIHSAVRRHFYPGEAAVFDGYLHYRGIVEGDSYLTGRSMVVVGHRSHRAIIYPIASLPGGKVLINWLAYTKIPSGAPPLEAWDTVADKTLAVERYQGWSYPWLDVQGLFARTERVLQLPNVDRDPALELFPRHADRGRGASDATSRGASRIAGDRRWSRARRFAPCQRRCGRGTRALPGPAHRRNERHDHPQSQSRSGNRAADRGRARARRIWSHYRRAFAPRARRHRGELQEGGRLRPRNSQQPPILCRAAASRDMRHLVPSRAQQCQTPAGGRMARVLFALFLASAMLLEPGPAASQTYPARQVHMVVTIPPGGNADTIARLVADKLTQHLRQPVIVENKPGAASIVGTTAVVQAPADGHTLLQVGTNVSTNPALGHKTSYDAERDLEPVALLVTVPAVVVVHPSLPVNTLAELIVHAKSRPGEVNYGSAGNGSFPHLTMEKLAQDTGIKLTHVPFRGFGPALIGLLRNDVNVLASDIPGALEHVRAGKLRALAVTGSTRMPMLPGVPTVAEVGVPDYEGVGFVGIMVRAGTPRDVIDVLNREINRALASPEIASHIAANGLVAGSGSPEDFAAFLKRDKAVWTKVIATGGIKGE